MVVCWLVDAVDGLRRWLAAAQWVGGGWRAACRRAKCASSCQLVHAADWQHVPRLPHLLVPSTSARRLAQCTSMCRQQAAYGIQWPLQMAGAVRAVAAAVVETLVTAWHQCRCSVAAACSHQHSMSMWLTQPPPASMSPNGVALRDGCLQNSFYTSRMITTVRSENGLPASQV